ncbi:hypothetical protein ACFLWO_01310 [Chloroflexota bacterium]
MFPYGNKEAGNVVRGQRGHDLSLPAGRNNKLGHVTGEVAGPDGVLESLGNNMVLIKDTGL